MRYYLVKRKRDTLRGVSPHPSPHIDANGRSPSSLCPFSLYHLNDFITTAAVSREPNDLFPSKNLRKSHFLPSCDSLETNDAYWLQILRLAETMGRWKKEKMAIELSHFGHLTIHTIFTAAMRSDKPIDPISHNRCLRNNLEASYS
jgi:hypothetical protein